jgi:heme A synthase
MASSLGALLLAGGLGGAIAFLSGLAFAHSGDRVLALGAVGALLACAFQITVVSGELADPVQHELLNAACLANALGWLAGTLLVARLRVLEYLNAQEAT